MRMSYIFLYLFFSEAGGLQVPGSPARVLPVARFAVVLREGLAEWVGSRRNIFLTSILIYLLGMQPLDTEQHSSCGTFSLASLSIKHRMKFQERSLVWSYGRFSLICREQYR